jgi:hypothetical protein
MNTRSWDFLKNANAFEGRPLRKECAMLEVPDECICKKTLGGNFAILILCGAIL